MKVREKLHNIVNEIVETMQKSEEEWVRFWKSAVPANFFTKKAYRGFNILVLIYIIRARGYKSPYFLTFNQAKKLGGMVKKGARSAPIFFFDYLEKEEEVVDEETQEVRIVKSKIPIMRRYNVFNIEDIEGIDWEDQVTDKQYEKIEKMIMRLGIKFIAGNPAYLPMKDVISMPPLSHFQNEDEYFAVLFHEMIHWSGAKTRLNRDLSGRLGSEEYAFEELVAELGSIFLCNHFGIEIKKARHASYLKGWLKKIKNDYRYLWRAASQAQKAVDYLLNSANLHVIDKVQLAA